MQWHPLLDPRKGRFTASLPRSLPRLAPLSVNPCAEAMRIVLDKDYLLLLWKDDSQPKRICDVYWIKRGYDPSDPQR